MYIFRGWAKGVVKRIRPHWQRAFMVHWSKNCLEVSNLNALGWLIRLRLYEAVIRTQREVYWQAHYSFFVLWCWGQPIYLGVWGLSYWSYVYLRLFQWLSSSGLCLATITPYDYKDERLTWSSRLIQTTWRNAFEAVQALEVELVEWIKYRFRIEHRYWIHFLRSHSIIDLCVCVCHKAQYMISRNHLKQ